MEDVTIDLANTSRREWSSVDFERTKLAALDSRRRVWIANRGSRRRTFEGIARCQPTLRVDARRLLQEKYPDTPFMWMLWSEFRALAPEA